MYIVLQVILYNICNFLSISFMFVYVNFLILLFFDSVKHFKSPLNFVSSGDPKAVLYIFKDYTSCKVLRSTYKEDYPICPLPSAPTSPIPGSFLCAGVCTICCSSSGVVSAGGVVLAGGIVLVVSLSGICPPFWLV